MADQGGVAKLAGSVVSGLSTPRSTGSATSRSVGSVGSSGNQGVGRREVPDAGRRQLINLDGKIFNRTAPRGTYLNILV